MSSINNSSSIGEDIQSKSKSEYEDACSNSIELNDFIKKSNIIKTSEKKLNKNSFSKEETISNFESPPKKSLNNNYNYTNNSTSIFSSNQTSNINKNLTEKNLNNKASKKRININSLDCVKKNILSPIDEKPNNIIVESSKDDLTNDNINNHNININIIINKKRKQKIENKFVFNNINNANDNINTDKNSSVYSSIDEITYSTIKKDNKIKELENEDEESNINNINNNNKNICSFLESNIGKKSIFGNSLSESIINNKDNFKKSRSSKENIVFFQDYSSLMINSVSFEDIAQDELTVNDLKIKYNLREIPVKRKDVPDKKKFLKTLIELQIFNFGDCPIWCMKISKNGKYLAAGNKIGKIRIYEIMGYDYEKYEKEYNSKNLMNFMHFVEEKPIKELYGHKSDITDLSWSPFLYDLLLSASVDRYVNLWDISKEGNCLIGKYDHNEIVTCVRFSPANKNIFVTGCFDKYVRIYNISDYIKLKESNNNNFNNSYNNIEENDDMKEENIQKPSKKKIKESLSNFTSAKAKDFFNLTDKITSISFFPDGNQISIGTINGKINIYELLDQNVRYNHSFTCRNKLGKGRFGKKVTSITFINKKQAIITTCDSCIRLFSMTDGKNIFKYRGYTNEKAMIRASVDLSSDIILSGSEDGFCYVWHIKNEPKKRKNYNYEYFQPFIRDIVECSLIIDEKCFVNYIKKVLRLTNKINIISVIINSSDKGKIEVLLNIDEDTK